MKLSLSTPSMNLEPNSTDRWRVRLNLFFALLQPLTPYLALLLGGKDIGVRSDESPSLFTPPDYVFAIWGPIFLSMIAFAVYQIREKNIVSSRLRRVGWFTASAMLLNIAWMFVVAIWGLGIIPGLIIAAMWAALMGAFFNLYSSTLPTRGELVFVIFPISIFSAWLTVATLAGAAGLLTQSQFFNGTVFSEAVRAGLLCAAAGVVACGLILRNNGNGFVTTVFVWALAGIGLKSYQSSEFLVLSGSVLGILTALAGYVHLHYRRGKSGGVNTRFA